MKILLAIFLPPLAVLLCGRPIAALLTIPLCIAFWIPGVIFALYVVMNSDADKRIDKLAAAMGKANRQ